MLLAIINGIRKGHITNNKVFITPELLLNFRETWKQLVDTGHTENFALPFFPFAVRAVLGFDRKTRYGDRDYTVGKHPQL